MKNQNTLYHMLKIIIPSGILIALVWLVLQISFFTNSWAQPGETSFFLFFIQIISVSILLFFSFQSYRNQFNNRWISFGKCLRLGFLIGIAVAVFGTILFLIHSNYINPNYESWLQEMYLQSWTTRGFSATEIQIIIFSIIPAFLVSKSNHKNQSIKLL